MRLPVRRPGLGLLQSAESHEGKKNLGPNWKSLSSGRFIADMCTVVGYTLAEAFKGRGSDGETIERRRRSEIVRVWAIDHFRPDASGHELRVIDSLWSRDRVTRSIEPHNFLIIEKARITVPISPSDALKRSIQFLFSLSSAFPLPSIRFPMEECRTDFISFFLVRWEKKINRS